MCLLSQYVVAQTTTSEANESGSNADGITPAHLAPNIGQDQEVAELENGGQWSPLPLEPEDYEGEVAVPEEYDSLALTAAREQVGSLRTVLLTYLKECLPDFGFQSARQTISKAPFFFLQH